MFTHALTFQCLSQHMMHTFPEKSDSLYNAVFFKSSNVETFIITMLQKMSNKDEKF